jgi:hypothetical protein
MDKQRLSAPAARNWTSPEAYVEGLIRLRKSRRVHHRPSRRTEPEKPHALLSTVPFAALLAALGVLSVAIMVADSPWHAVPPVKRQVIKPERGTAARGWFQEAQKDMHR